MYSKFKSVNQRSIPTKNRIVLGYCWLLYWFRYWAERSATPPQTVWHHVSTHECEQPVWRKQPMSDKAFGQKCYTVQSVCMIVTVIRFSLFWLKSSTLNFKCNNDDEVKVLTSSYGGCLRMLIPKLGKQYGNCSPVYPIGVKKKSYNSPTDQWMWRHTP